jgi:hypothetical protein
MGFGIGRGEQERRGGVRGVHEYLHGLLVVVRHHEIGISRRRSVGDGDRAGLWAGGDALRCR